MPSSKFNQRPVPRRRPAICASFPKPAPAPPPAAPLAKVTAAPQCLPPVDVLLPNVVKIAFGWIDLDPALPPDDRPNVSAIQFSDFCDEIPRTYHALTIPPPWNLEVWLELSPTPGLLDATLKLSRGETVEEKQYPAIRFDPSKPFDTGLFGDTVIPYNDYRWIHAIA